MIQSVIVTSLTTVSIDMDIIFFDADPSATTFTENAALDINDADLINIIGIAQITAWSTFADNEAGQSLQLALPFVGEVGDSLFATIVTRGAPTFVGTGDITLRVGVLRAN